MKCLTLRKCFGCSQPRTAAASFQVCSRCKGAEYCSVTCQRNHFSDHKKFCKKLGTTLTDFEAKFFENPTIKEFVVEGTEKDRAQIEMADMKVQEMLIRDEEYLLNHFVELVRAIQPIVAVYISMAVRAESKFPIKKALLWLLRALKVVAYHTDYFSRKEEKAARAENASEKGDNQDVSAYVEDTVTESHSSNNNSIDTTKLLRFGGDWDTEKKAEDPDRHKSCHSSKGSGGYNCEYYAKRAERLENSPSGHVDPFFCFGGRFNIPEVYMLMGKYQEAYDYICHFANTSLEFPQRGFVISHWKQWHMKQYVSVSIYKDHDISWSLFEGDEDSKHLLRVYGVLILIRLYATRKIDGGEHTASDPEVTREANLEYLRGYLQAMISLSADFMYFITGNEQHISYMSRMNLMCGQDPKLEVGNRLVWHLFRMLSADEGDIFDEAYLQFLEDNRI